MWGIEFSQHIYITFPPVNIGSKKTLLKLPLQPDDRVTVLMGRATITYVNVIFSQYRTMTRAHGRFEIACTVSAGPWIPIRPGSQQDQDLDVHWQEEDEED
jgi:hypothetical protein